MSFYENHQTPALDAFENDIAKLRRAAELLEEVWQVTDNGHLHQARVPNTRERYTQELETAIKKAIKASEEGRAKDAIQDMLDILTDALLKPPAPATKEQEEKARAASALRSKLQNHFGFDDSE